MAKLEVNMDNLSLIQACKQRLIQMKGDVLNRFRAQKLEVSAIEKMLGDEVDQSTAQQQEDHFILNQNRLKFLLLEIELALQRIENGSYGICEETQEPIEEKRLLILPYTRLSIEGAELREDLQKKFAR
jgi:DnaK suppressor protein